MAEVILRPLMSGHCAFPSVNTLGGMGSHERCHANGGGQRANPAKQFQPCPCPCHYVNDEGILEVFECGGCGRDIAAAPLWPYDDDGELRYTHVDDEGRALGEDCEPEPKRRTAEPAPVPDHKDCVRCGRAFKGNSASRLCPSCVRDDERAAKVAAKAETDEYEALLASLEDALEDI